MWPTILAVVFGVLFVAAAIAAVWLFAQRQALREQRATLERDLADTTTQVDTYRQAIREHEQEVAQLQRQLAVADEQQQGLKRQFDEAQQMAQKTFESLAHDALDKSYKRFVELASQRFKTEQSDASKQLEARKQAIEALVKPVREALSKQEQAFAEMDKRHRESHGGLSERLRALLEAQDRLQSSTQNLTMALRRPEVRGRWGEIQLRRVAELAGMIPHCDFNGQQTQDTEGGARRPDMVVNLPAGRTIVIDSKTPINAYIEAIECESDDDRATCLERHARHIEDQVRALSAKDYQRQFDRAPDFVVLFIPGEAFLHAAVQVKPDLIERAMNLNVVIATPTTLISLLKAVEMGWREERLAESAEQIKTLGVELHTRVATLIEKVQVLGDRLEKTIKAYNDMVGSLETRVAVTARKFKELGADSNKELPAEGEMRIIERTPRPISLPEEAT